MRPRQGASTAGRWRSISVRGGSSRALPVCPCVYAGRLMTAGDAAGRRLARGPWTDWMVCSGAGYTAAGTPKQEARSLGVGVGIFVVLVQVWLVVHVVRPGMLLEKGVLTGICFPKHIFSKA